MRVPRNALIHLTPDGDLVPGVAAGHTRLWPFTQSWRFAWRSRDPGRLDPVNLLVLQAPPDVVRDALTARGWRRPDDGATHRTWVDGTFRRMHDHVALGDRAERVHVRLFSLASGTLIAAHHEVANDRGAHRVTSWDRARAETAAALESAGFARLSPTGPITPPDLRGVPSDGRAWRFVGPVG
jgi:hypothetical protein